MIGAGRTGGAENNVRADRRLRPNRGPPCKQHQVSCCKRIGSQSEAAREAALVPLVPCLRYAANTIAGTTTAQHTVSTATKQQATAGAQAKQGKMLTLHDDEGSLHSRPCAARVHDLAVAVPPLV